MAHVAAVDRARGDRKRFMERLHARRAYYETAKCGFWVFEESDLPGALIEFVEAADRETLEKCARRCARPHRGRGANLS